MTTDRPVAALLIAQNCRRKRVKEKQRARRWAIRDRQAWLLLLLQRAHSSWVKYRGASLCGGSQSRFRLTWLGRSSTQQPEQRRRRCWQKIRRQRRTTQNQRPGRRRAKERRLGSQQASVVQAVAGQARALSCAQRNAQTKKRRRERSGPWRGRRPGACWTSTCDPLRLRRLPSVSVIRRARTWLSPELEPETALEG